MRSVGVVISVITWGLCSILITDLSTYECVSSVALTCIGASTFQILIILEKTEGMNNGKDK